MAGAPENADPASFWQADVGVAVDLLLEVIGREQPDVIVSPNRYRTDRHPDHVKAAAVARFSARFRPITTRVDIGPYLARKTAAMQAHRSQIDPRSQVFALSPQTRQAVIPTEDFTLCGSRVGVALPETDLFAGLRPTADEA